MPKVIVSVLNWMNYKKTINCVNSIIEETKQLADQIEIVIIDNASQNNSVNELKAAFPDLEIIVTPENCGYADGHKVVYDLKSNSDFELLWILNNDVIVQPCTLQNLVKAYLRNGIGLYGSISLSGYDESSIEFGGGEEIKTFDVIPGELYNPFDGKKWEESRHLMHFRWVPVVYGCSFIIPKLLIQKYGFMSSDFFLYHEETDYCLDLFKKGIKSYVVPESIVIHSTTSSIKINKRVEYAVAYYRSRNALLLNRRIYNKKVIKSFLEDIVNLNLLFKFLKLWLLKSINERKYPGLFLSSTKEYYTYLGKIHFYLFKCGKTIAPEKFL